VFGRFFAFGFLNMSGYEIGEMISGKLGALVAVSSVAVVYAEQSVVGVVIEIGCYAVAILIRFIFIFWVIGR
jgi:hypothetical protein